MLSQAVAMLCVCCALLGQALSKTQIPTCPMISDDISPLYSHYIPTISPLYPCCIPVVSYYIISISIIIITSLHHYIIIIFIISPFFTTFVCQSPLYTYIPMKISPFWLVQRKNTSQLPCRGPAPPPPRLWASFPSRIPA